MKWFLSDPCINVANINSDQKIISFCIQFKNERLAEILQAVSSKFYDCINTI